MTISDKTQSFNINTHGSPCEIFFREVTAQDISNLSTKASIFQTILYALTCLEHVGMLKRSPAVTLYNTNTSVQAIGGNFANS